MLNVEVRFLISGQEVSLDSFAAALVADIRRAVREEIDRLSNQAVGKNLGPAQQHDHKTPPVAVSKREPVQSRIQLKDDKSEWFVGFHSDSRARRVAVDVIRYQTPQHYQQE